HHAKAINVNFRRNSNPTEPLWGKVPHSSSECRQNPTEIPSDDRRQPKVCNFRDKAFTEKYVFRLNIAVYDAFAAALMQVGQPSSNSDGYMESGAPAEDISIIIIALEKMRIKRTIAHPLITLATEPNQSDQVDVLDQPERAHLRPELLLPLALAVEPLHRYNASSPLNTDPKPPAPSFSEKFLVARPKSAYLKATTPTLPCPAVSCDGTPPHKLNLFLETSRSSSSTSIISPKPTTLAAITAPATGFLLAAALGKPGKSPAARRMYREQLLRQALSHSLRLRVAAGALCRLWGPYGSVTRAMGWNTSVDGVDLVSPPRGQSSFAFLEQPPVRSPSSQSRGDAREKLSMHSHGGSELPVQTVKGPQAAYTLQASMGWVKMLRHDWLACDHTFRFTWPDVSTEKKEEDDSSGDYSSSLVLTYAGTITPLVAGFACSSACIACIAAGESAGDHERLSVPVLTPLPLVSSPQTKEPKPGSTRLFHEVKTRFMPVALFQPILAPGSKAWVGSSKLCHTTTASASAAPPCICMTRHPLPKRTALTLLVVVVSLAVWLLVVDQTMALVAPLETTRLPSAMIGVVGDRPRPVRHPDGSGERDLVEPYGEVPTGGRCGRFVTDVAVAGAAAGLEEAERELAVAGDELLADGECLAWRESIVFSSSRTRMNNTVQGEQEEDCVDGSHGCSADTSLIVKDLRLRCYLLTTRKRKKGRGGRY
ncbi:hypothetical protein U9M48_031939, partial [Paspalum notatum var. saurae]